MNNLGNKETMAKNIKRYMDSHNIDRKDLATVTGVAYTTLSDWLNAKTYPRIDKIEKMAYFFGISKADLVEEYNPTNNVGNNHNEYRMFPVSISAGCLEDIEAIDTYDIVTIADEIMGKYAGRKGIILLKVNGESMNNVIPDGSYIVVDTSKTKVTDISDRDIVVFSENGSYSVKRYVNDIANERFLFKPDSTDDTFTAIEVKYEESINLKLIGKVVKYIVNSD
ncbi:LexA family protein [Peptostreptococcus sp.]|uniref:LexA family protein n=1 Tax=Peptostreptococcus sp. TaxID=1262 RepID=UPI001DE64413|nr:XRE family transcriptional regulator [Peptostreptococcus sp.]MBS5595696.1 LexA family transcriptional regulator [Peptostreptococcus sp.]